MFLLEFVGLADNVLNVRTEVGMPWDFLSQKFRTISELQEVSALLVMGTSLSKYDYLLGRAPH